VAGSGGSGSGYRIHTPTAAGPPGAALLQWQPGGRHEQAGAPGALQGSGGSGRGYLQEQPLYRQHSQLLLQQQQQQQQDQLGGGLQRVGSLTGGAASRSSSGQAYGTGSPQQQQQPAFMARLAGQQPTLERHSGVYGSGSSMASELQPPTRQGSLYQRHAQQQQQQHHGSTYTKGDAIVTIPPSPHLAPPQQHPAGQPAWEERPRAADRQHSLPPQQAPPPTPSAEVAAAAAAFQQLLRAGGAASPISTISSMSCSLEAEPSGGSAGALAAAAGRSFQKQSSAAARAGAERLAAERQASRLSSSSSTGSASTSSGRLRGHRAEAEDSASSRPGSAGHQQGLQAQQAGAGRQGVLYIDAFTPSSPPMGETDGLLRSRSAAGTPKHRSRAPQDDAGASTGARQAAADGALRAQAALLVSEAASHLRQQLAAAGREPHCGTEDSGGYSSTSEGRGAGALAGPGSPREAAGGLPGPGFGGHSSDRGALGRDRSGSRTMPDAAQQQQQQQQRERSSASSPSLLVTSKSIKRSQVGGASGRARASGPDLRPAPTCPTCHALRAPACGLPLQPCWTRGPACAGARLKAPDLLRLQVVPISDALQQQTSSGVDATFLQQLEQQLRPDSRSQGFSFRPQGEQEAASLWGSSAASSVISSPARSPSPSSRPTSRLGAAK
jgi:hypothetical protein